MEDLLKDINEKQVEGLLASGERIRAIKLVMEQSGMGLKESKEYVDHLKAHKNNNIYYSRITENGLNTYSKAEDGRKRGITRSEVPTGILDMFENRIHLSHSEANLPAESESYLKKAIKIFTFVSFFLLALFLILKFKLRNQVTDYGVLRLYCVGGLTLVSVSLVLLLQLNRHIYIQRKRMVEEIEIPEVFEIKDKNVQGWFWISGIIGVFIGGVGGWAAILAIQVQSWKKAAVLIALLIFGVIFGFRNVMDHYTSSKLRLCISKDTIYVRRGEQEDIIIKTDSIGLAHFYRKERIDKYPTVEIAGTKIYLKLSDYHLLKKYFQQQHVLIKDDYNRF